MKYFFRIFLPIVLLIPLLACEADQGAQLIHKANNDWIKGRNHSAIEIFKSVLKL